jgi:hypothetical protein
MFAVGPLASTATAGVFEGACAHWCVRAAVRLTPSRRFITPFAAVALTRSGYIASRVVGGVALRTMVGIRWLRCAFVAAALTRLCSSCEPSFGRFA